MIVTKGQVKFATRKIKLNFLQFGKISSDIYQYCNLSRCFKLFALEFSFTFACLAFGRQALTF
ncbi:MAG: hypothetical protein LBP59_06570 [Planctomycetaceae bacterium]|nr:hypothetical protein [Planctomycetaceae bacterium]